MIDFIAKQINQYSLQGIVIGFILGFIFASISGKLFRWLFTAAILVALAYLYYHKSLPTNIPNLPTKIP